MYCFFANVKIKQAKQDWPNLPVLGSHSTKSSSSLEHSADETRSSDVGCACQRKNNGVGKRERREVRKPTNKSIKYLSLCPASHRHYCFSSLKRACGRMENFKLLCSCEWLWVQTNGTGFRWSSVTQSGSRGSSLSHLCKSLATAWFSPDFNFNFQNQKGRKRAITNGGQFKNASQHRNALQL